MFIPYRKLMPPIVTGLLVLSFALGVYLPARNSDFAAVEVLSRTPSASESVDSLVRSGPGGLLRIGMNPDDGKTMPKREKPLKLSAISAIAVDVGTKTVLYEKNARMRRAPASTTKILTALIAMEKGDMDDILTVSRKAAATPGSSMHLKSGDKLRLRDMLTGLLLKSGNDAAQAVAEHIGGNKGHFAGLMNQRAMEMGATRSHFVNPHGLDNGDHYTTAEDLAIIALNAIENPIFAGIVRTRKASVSSVEAWEKDVSNTNQLLWSFEGAEGIKTGTTGNAGQCLIALATRMGRQVLTVILGSRSRYWDSKVLLEYGFSDFTLVTSAEKGEIVKDVDVVRGMKDNATLVAGETTQFLVPAKDLSDLDMELKLPSPLRAPLRKGQIIGRMVATIGLMEVSSTPLMVKEAVQERTWWRTIMEWAVLWARDVVGILKFN